MEAALSLTDRMLAEVRSHLFGQGAKREEGGFLFCSAEEDVGGVHFAAQLWMPLRPRDYLAHEVDYLELTDETRARVIKQAHDRNACLVEVHSHPGPWPACFSPSDLSGLAQFVPHVRWRLKRRPYGALVFAQSGFDGLAWTGDGAAACVLRRLITSTTTLQGTGLTFGRREDANE